ncbi:MAG: hypothetical protein RLN96_10270 [Pseudomonadales bacterium]
MTFGKGNPARWFIAKVLAILITADRSYRIAIGTPTQFTTAGNALAIFKKNHCTALTEKILHEFPSLSCDLN